ncbi:hypothetical protein V8E53_003747 [Lactarius tabidus]
MVESRGVGIREIEGVLLSTKKITSASKGGVMDRREVRALARQILQIETCTFGGVQADEGCGRQRGPKRARMPPAGGKGEGKGAGLGTESSWRRGRSHGKARSILSIKHTDLCEDFIFGERIRSGNDVLKGTGRSFWQSVAVG